MPNGGQFGAFRRQPRSNRASGAKCLCPARNRRSGIPVIVVKCEVCFAIAPRAAGRFQRAQARAAAFQADCTDYSRPMGRIDQSGTAAVSACVVRAATTFCIIVMNRFCSALLRPSSVS